MVQAEEPSDGALLAAFAATRDEGAFEAIVRRHGAMVLRVCHCVLGRGQDAEDAAQAAFLALARSAGSLGGRASVGPWLHQVAHRVAVDACRLRKARQERERKAVIMAPSERETGAAELDERAALLHAELQHLPDRQRQALVLFHLEGRSLEETARVLECPLSTAGNWLARGRERLRDRMVRRGFALSVVGLISVFSAEARGAELPAGLASTMVRAAALAAAGQAAGGVLSAQAALLAEGALRAMSIAKLKWPAAMLAGLVICGLITPWYLRAKPKEKVGQSPAPVVAPLSVVEQQPAQADPAESRSPENRPTPPPGPPPRPPTDPAPPPPPPPVPATTTVGMKSGGRHGQHSKQAAQGPHMRFVAGTFFGSKDYEEFVDAGALPDGMIVAFGNASGPRFPDAPAPTVYGRGAHTGQPGVVKDARGNESVNHSSNDLAGVLVYYTPDLSAMQKVIRFDWGVANILAAMLTADGQGLILAGRCGPNFASLAQLAPMTQKLPYQPPDPAAATGRKKPAPPADPATLSDVYVARFTAQGKPQWFWVLEKNNNPPDKLFTDSAGAIYFDANGLQRISPDGRELRLISARTKKWLAVDPKGDAAYFGGDRNTSTGREPYRNPFLDKVDLEGKTVWTLWNFPSREIGADDCRLVADSSVRAITVAPDGNFYVSGWSDGGNTVFPKQCADWRNPATSMGMGMAVWGMQGANSLCHIMKIDPVNKLTLAQMAWSGFLPSWFGDAKKAGAPNGLGIRQMKVLDDNSLAVTGGAGTGLIETPGAFWTDPETGDKYGGDYVAVFRPDLSNLEFSSYLPGCSGTSLARCTHGLLVVSASRGNDGRDRPTPTPVRNALQSEYKGGTDAHILVLELP